MSLKKSLKSIITALGGTPESNTINGLVSEIPANISGISPQGVGIEMVTLTLDYEHGNSCSHTFAEMKELIDAGTMLILRCSDKFAYLSRVTAGEIQFSSAYDFVSGTTDMFHLMAYIVSSKDVWNVRDKNATVT